MAATNEPRFDHDPDTLAPLGLLIEEQRTNLASHSEAFDNAVWAKALVTVTSNQVVAPDGTQTADALIENSAEGGHYTQQDVTEQAGTLTFSVFAKAKDYSVLRLRPIHFGAAEADTTIVDFTLDGSGSHTTPAAHASARIVAYPEGWYLCSVTVTLTGAVTSLHHRIQLLKDGAPDYQGDGTSGIYLWGAQLEEGAFPTSYIPTVTSSQATRAADHADITNIEAFYNHAEGSLFAEWIRGYPEYAGAVNDLTGIVSLNAGNIFGYHINGAKSNSVIQVASRNADGITTLTVGAEVLGEASKAALAYSVSDLSFKFTSNGLPAASGLLRVNSNTNLRLGRQARQGVSSAIQYMNGHLSRVVYYPRALSDAELEALTA